MIIEGAVAATMYVASKKVEDVIVPPFPQTTIEKFKKWEKEDWIKDDLHADMWDKNWINKKN